MVFAGMEEKMILKIGRKKKDEASAVLGQKKKGKLFFFIGIIVAVIVVCLNVIQNVTVTKMSRSAIESDLRFSYDAFAKQSKAMIENRLETYFAHLDFYTNADVVKSGDSEQIWDWYKAHASVRPDVFDYVAWADRDGRFLADINSSSTISDRDYWQQIMIRGSDFAVDDPVTARSTGKTVTHICKAAKVNGQTVGFACGVVTVEHIERIIDGIDLKDIGVAVLFDSTGRVLATSSNKAAFIADFEKIKERNGIDLKKFADALTKKERSAISIKNGAGKGQYVILDPIQYTPWKVGVFLNDSKIYHASNLVAKILGVSGIIIIVFIISIVASILFFSLRPLTVVENTIRGIASGDADLTKRIEIDTNNEIGGVVEGFNQFAGKLHTIVSTMKSSKDSLVDAGRLLADSTADTSAAITQIIANIDAMNSNVTRQTDSVHQTAGAVNEIASNIESLNKMIESQAYSVSQASAAVEEMIGNINSVNGSVKKMAAAFEELEEKAQTGVQKQNDVNAKISEIETESQALQEANAVISGIAEQTNLLAMNAAIEAAHAGEAGKGFSVVADEIRKLSEDSGSQSQTIGTQLSRITATIEEIVFASQLAGEAFSEVCNGINMTNNLVSEITNAMEEQNAGSHQISVALQTVNDTSNEVKTASFEMSEGNKAILMEVKTLQDATFSIKDGMEEMSAGARKINETGAALSAIASQMDSSIQKIGEQVDQFKV